jgi:acetate---CoA ligase (ADP-forming) subunit beta
MNIIERALEEKRTTLSEHESSEFLLSYGIPVARQVLVRDAAQLAPALKQLGYPVVLKGCSFEISHKTEKGLVRMDVRTESEARDAYDEIRSAMGVPDPAVLVQELIKGERQLMVGLTRDPQFGPTVMFGLGGIFTEILRDVSFRLAPLELPDALDMMRDIKGHRILDAVRGMEPVDREALALILINLGRIGVENPRIKEIDINPLIIRGATPIAVDALIVVE